MKTILFIEDNKDILENLTEYMEMEGYTVLAANTGKRGIEFAKKFTPDLIICDVLMNEMDGYEVLRILLKEDVIAGIPFVFSTSLSEKIDRRESLALGADDYIVKPFELEALLSLVETWTKAGSKRLAKSSRFQASEHVGGFLAGPKTGLF